MKARVIAKFYDLEHPENTYEVGSEFEGTEERVRGLADKGFVEMPEQPKPRRRRAKKQPE